MIQGCRLGYVEVMQELGIGNKYQDPSEVYLRNSTA